MILIIEIILTIVAWNKGWKAKALLPMGICLAIGILIGMIIGSVGVTSVPLGLIVFDIAAVVVLIVMICKPPKKDSIIDSGPALPKNDKD